MNQLTNDPDVYASVDLYSYQEMDEETEEYMNDLAFYLINTSDDIWQTIDFFEKKFKFLKCYRNEQWRYV
ncbi:MAG: hypothetical protein Ct9H90mP20_2950 [Candidatus Neomarinimicrobiota bacterium]|nr:MAG: hypothetical protein Ct9H90mP20_2950 [Candidatus Neomarinimicrobiota bacterium]